MIRLKIQKATHLLESPFLFSRELEIKSELKVLKHHLFIEIRYLSGSYTCNKRDDSVPAMFRFASKDVP